MERVPPRRSRLLWFAGLWLAGVASVGVLSVIIKLMLGA
jgi:hypothetical protein